MPITDRSAGAFNMAVCRWFGRLSFIIILGLVAIAFGWLMGGAGMIGCSTRHYQYRTADGATIDILIQGTDATLGSIEANRQMPDGSVVSLHIENLTQTDRALEVTSKVLDKLPAIPFPMQ